MPNVELYLDRYQGTKVSYPTCTFDFTTSIEGTDYILNETDGEHVKCPWEFPYPADPDKTVKVMTVQITTAGIDKLSQVTPPAQNPLKLDPWGSASGGSNVPVRSVQGKPADWDLHWRDKYYTRTATTHDNKTYYQYTAVKTAIYDPNTSYFELDTQHPFQYLWWTLDGNVFGFSQGWRITSSADGPVYQQWVNLLTPLYYPVAFGEATDIFSWRCNGVNGPTFAYNPWYASSYQPMLRGNTGYCADEQLDVDIVPQFIGFTYDEEDYFGIIMIQYGSDGIPLGAVFTGVSKVFFEGELPPPNSGPDSFPQGGSGIFTAVPTGNRGDRNGYTISNIATAWNNGLGSIITTAYDCYFVRPYDSVSLTAFQQFMHKIWQPDFIKSLLQAMVDPTQAIITCHAVPSGLFSQTPSGSSRIECIGLKMSNDVCSRFSERFKWTHIGDVDFSQLYSDSFADYTNTSAFINLPYIDVVQIDVSSFNGGWISIDYVTDGYTGDCTAFITTCDKDQHVQVRYSYKGNCSTSIEVRARIDTGVKMIGKVGPGLVQIGAVIAGQMAGGYVENVAYSAAAWGSDATVSRAIAGANSIVAEQGIYEGLLSNTGAQIGARAGSIIGTSIGQGLAAASSGAATLNNNATQGGPTSPSDTMCWIYISRPVWSNPRYFASHKGYPSDIGGTVSDFDGFFKAQSVDLSGIVATDGEKAEIDQWLHSGVYLTPDDGNYEAHFE